MNPNELQKVFQTVAKNLRCPHCGQKYDFDKIHLVSSAGHVCFLKLECESHMPMMASVALPSDNKIGQKECFITDDEIIDGYKMLSQANNINELFN